MAEVIILFGIVFLVVYLIPSISLFIAGKLFPRVVSDRKDQRP